MINKTKILLKNGHIVTMNGNEDILTTDILIEGDTIRSLENSISDNSAEIFDASEYLIIPGLIQTHIHLCQTLFRNLADDLTLMNWLSQKIWPFEGKHTPESLRISAQLGIAELLLGGTTTILDMGTVHHMDVVFEELVNSGIRAFSGKTMMDFGDMPAALHENTKESIDNSLALLDRWHRSANNRIRYAFAPRFIPSCSEDLLSQTARLAEEYSVPFHTHAAENREEVKLVEELHNERCISYLEKKGITAPHVCLAHCVWLDNKEKDILSRDQVKVLHCPGSNLKLGSGIAPIPEYLDRGITVSIGADGAPCNNNLDMFNEMRLAALIQKPHFGADSMDAQTVFRMATVEGAKTLGIKKQTGSIEAGKKADLAILKLNQVNSIPFDNIYSKLVYSTNSSAVEHVMVDGQWVVKDKKLVNYNIDDIISRVNASIPEFLN